MACKLVVLGQRKEDMTHEECVEYMREEHVPKVKDMPGLQKYKTAVPVDPDDAGYDEMAELWFEDPAAVNEAFESEAGQRVMADAEEFVDVERTEMFVVTDETTHLDDT